MRLPLLIVLMMLATGCGKADLYNLFGVRMFKVGDCLIQSSREVERWEQRAARYQVIELGKRSYLIKDLINDTTDSISYGHLWEDFYQKVECN